MDKKWNWVSLVDRLSGSDITKHDLVYDRNWIECLNLLSFWNERDFIVEQQQKAWNLKNKIK